MTQAERDMAHALELVYGSDQSIEAGAVMDKLYDLGWRLTTVPAVRGEQPEPASTSRLPKRANA